MVNSGYHSASLPLSNCLNANSLSVFYTNTNHNPKRSALNAELASNSCAIVILTETHLDNVVANTEVFIPVAVVIDMIVNYIGKMVEGC